MIVPVEERERFEIATAMSVAMGGWEFGARDSQTIVFERPVRIDDPARQDRQSLLDIETAEFLKVEPLAARVGPGELLGARQTGLPDYRVANLVRDAELMPQVQVVAETLRKNNADTAAAIVRRWLGDAGRYGKV